MGNVRSRPESIERWRRHGSRPESIERWRRHGSRTKASLPSQALDSGPAPVSGTPQQAEELEICFDDIEPSPLGYSRRVLMRGGLGLTEPPEVTQWQSFEEIYLMENELTDLSEDPPQCPLLLVLFLNRNYKLRTISPSFFDFMPALEILNLSRTRIKSLPESLFGLSRLKRLFLNHCELLMVLPPKIGQLQQLEVLDLEGTEIMDLPKEVAKLTKLTCLDVSFCPRINRGTKSVKANALIPQGTISALSQLEELSIDVNPEDERWESVVEAIVDDVCGLLRLDTLKLYFPQVGYLRKFKWFGTSEVSRSLSHFKFIVGNQDERVMSCIPVDLEFELEHWDRSLKYVNGEGVPIEVQKMLRHAIAFFLDRHTDVTKLSDFGIENMEQLTCCIIGECNEIQVIIDGTDMYDEANRSEIVLETWENDKRFLGSLEYLYTYHMKSLRSIYEGPMHRGCLSHLKRLALLTCPRLTTIFTPGLLENLDSLEELKVEDCPLILSLVRCEDACIYENTYFLPKLKNISLFSLPELISISNGLRIAPNLEQLSVVDCPNLKSSSPNEICFNHPTGTKAQSIPNDASREQPAPPVVSSTATAQSIPNDASREQPAPPVVSSTTTAQSIPNDASREQPAPPVVSSTTTGNADPSTSKLKREPKVAPRLWKSLFNDRKLAARNFSAASLLGVVGSGCACGFTNDTSREQPAPTGVLFTPTSTAIDAVSSTTTSNTAISSSILSKTTSNTTVNTLTSELTEEIIVAPQLRKFSLIDLKLATRNFSPKALLGEGGFSRVFKGWIEENGTAAARPGTGLTVAVKTLNLDGWQGHKEWLAVAGICGHLEHPNLVKLIGYCVEDDQRLLIYEFMQRGSLNNHLFRRGTRPLPWSTRMKIALDAAKVLAFLHEEAEPQVIFRGFKTSKILLDADYNAKLCGSGLAKIIPKGDHHVYTRVLGTYGYAAPEYLATGLLTAKCDVYNFGVVLLEILTGQRVIDQGRPSLEINLVEYVRPHLGRKKKLHELMDPGLKEFSKQGVQIAFKLAARCLSLDPKARPQMKEVVQVLKGLPDLPYEASSSTIFITRQESTSSGMASKVEPR